MGQSKKKIGTLYGKPIISGSVSNLQTSNEYILTEGDKIVGKNNKPTIVNTFKKIYNKYINADKQTVIDESDASFIEGNYIDASNAQLGYEPDSNVDNIGSFFCFKDNSKEVDSYYVGTFSTGCWLCAFKCIRNSEGRMIKEDRTKISLFYF